MTFHLPDGSQESCSDSGLGDHEPVGSGTLLSHPLPLVQPQEDFYQQASPDKRTEADGNSDPNSGEFLTTFLWMQKGDFCRTNQRLVKARKPVSTLLLNFLYPLFLLSLCIIPRGYHFSMQEWYTIKVQLCIIFLIEYCKDIMAIFQSHMSFSQVHLNKKYQFPHLYT